jgi:hypothetical protein
MFNFRKILAITFDRISGEATAAYYNIIGAQLDSDSGTYDETPDGANMFEIDLEPVDDELDKPISGLTIVAGNSGDWAHVQRGLDPKAEHEVEPGHFELDMVDAYIAKNLLIVPMTAAEEGKQA